MKTEGINTADKKPQIVQDPETHKTRVRMVPVDKDIVKREGMKTFKKMRQERALSKAELKKRNDVAKAIKKDDPDMPMDKKMAIATSVAKKTAEAAEYPHPMYDPKSGEKVMAKTPADHDKYAKMGYTHEKPDMNEVSSNTLGNYMRKSAAAAAKPGASARTQDKRIGGQKMADNKIRKKMGYSSPAKVPAGKNEDDASARMYRDNPDMMKQQGPGGFKSLDPKMQKTIKNKMKKLPPKPTKENVDEGPARDRLLKIMNKASGRTMADREKDAAAATARRKEADKDLKSFRQKMGK